MQSSDPFFSVVIPTRNRPDTLKYAIQSVVAQLGVPAELIVSDNSSSTYARETRAVVDAAKYAAREHLVVRYVRPKSELPMAQHWEFAVSHASGKYLILIGDDDCLLRHAFKELHALITSSAAQVIAWMPAFYYWPELPTNAANRSNIPISQGIRRRKALSVVRSVLRHPSDYFCLPMAYNSVIHLDIVQQIKRSAGRFFGSESPDIYSGFVVASQVGEYMYTTVPMSAMGTSAKSNGRAHFAGGDETVSADFDKLNRTAGIRKNPKSLNLPLICASVVDSFLEASETMQCRCLTGKFSKKHLNRTVFRELEHRNIIELQSFRSELLRFFGQRQVKAKLDELIARKEYSQVGDDARFTAPKGSYNGDNYLFIDCERHGVTNVDEFAQLVEYLLYYNQNGIHWPNDSIVAGLRRRLGLVRNALYRLLLDAF